LKVDVPSDASEDESARNVREYFFCSIGRLMLLFKAHLTNLDLVHSPDDRDLDLATPGQILSLATNTRSAQYARKHLTMHKIRLWESNLEAARARVLECEGVIQDLRREVDEITGTIGMIENGLNELQHAMLPAESLDASADSIGSGSIDSP
jgi:hypothetical protein